MNILLIAIDFFNYDKIIYNELKSQGHNVTLCYDQPHRFIKGIEYHLPRRIVNFENKRYQKKIIRKNQNKKFDIVLVIVGRYLFEETLEKIKNGHRNAKFILYLWDDIARVENFERVRKYYDSIFSFDNVDCEKEQFSFLPLFYTRDCSIDKFCKKEIEIFSNLSMHSDRYDILCNIINKYPDWKILIKMYVLPKIYFSWIFKGLLQVKTNDYKIDADYKSLSRKEMIEFMHKSKCVLDIQAPSQNGLTMRSIETLGCGVKLITTNENIIHYDFYNENNILVIDRNNIVIPKDFIDKDYIEISEDIYSNYSISNWIHVLLGTKNGNYFK